MKVNAKINLEKMDMFLADKPIDVTDSMEEPTVTSSSLLLSSLALSDTQVHAP